jgi:IS1 family transposase
MSNNLTMDKQILITSALAEGSSIRAIERITGVHRDTIMRLGVKIGQACTAMMDKTMVNLPCKRIQLDEIWGFVGCKKKNLKELKRDPNEFGDVWTFIAIDADTKLVPCFLSAKRDRRSTEKFMVDLEHRMANRIQLSTDALKSYEEAVSYAFGNDIDYAQSVKTFASTMDTKGKYSPPELIKVEKHVFVGNPDDSKISTSYVESQNLTLRMHCRRLTRLTNAFSKKLDNFKASIGLHFGYYNFVKIHSTLRTTPAMATGLAKHPWTVGELIERSLSVK